MKQLVLAILVLSTAASVSAQSKPGEERPGWCQKSDIPTDARIHRGHLDNAYYRFTWMPSHGASRVGPAARRALVGRVQRG
jgi:hypothetical protein